MQSKKVGIFNPLSEDFRFKYDVNNDKKPVSFTIPARDVVYFEKHLAEHGRKALVDEMLNRHWPADANVEKAKKEFRKQTRV